MIVAGLVLQSGASQITSTFPGEPATFEAVTFIGAFGEPSNGFPTRVTVPFPAFVTQSEPLATAIDSGWLNSADEVRITAGGLNEVSISLTVLSWLLATHSLLPSAVIPMGWDPI